MPMRCPRCSTPPPFDPFLCTSCGEHLLTYLDEPLGPGTGLNGERPEARSAATGTAERPGDGGDSGVQTGVPPPQPAAARAADNTGPFILKLLFGLFIAMVLVTEETMAGVLFLGPLALSLWRWPRARLLVFIPATIGIAAVAWFSAELVDELIDEIDTPSFIATSTPTPDYAATSTAVAVAGTPTLAPAARTATATVVTGENRVKISRARARWLRGDNATARTELDDALTLIPGLAETLNLRALVRIADGDYQGGAADAERAVRAQPSNPVYRDTRAYALLKLGRYDAAASEYDTVLSDPRSDAYVAAYLGRGVARTALGRLVEARADLDMGLKLLPEVRTLTPSLPIWRSPRARRSTRWRRGRGRRLQPRPRPDRQESRLPAPAASPVALRPSVSRLGRAP